MGCETTGGGGLESTGGGGVERTGGGTHPGVTVVVVVRYPLILLVKRSTLSGMKTCSLAAVSWIKFLASLNPSPLTSERKGSLHLPSSEWSPTTLAMFSTMAASSLFVKNTFLFLGSSRSLEVVDSRWARRFEGWLLAKFSLTQTLASPCLLKPIMLSLTREGPHLLQAFSQPSRDRSRTQRDSGQVSWGAWESRWGMCSVMTFMQTLGSFSFFCLESLDSFLGSRTAESQALTRGALVSLLQSQMACSLEVAYSGSTTMVLSSPSLPWLSVYSPCPISFHSSRFRLFDFFSFPIHDKSEQKNIQNPIAFISPTPQYPNSLKKPPWPSRFPPRGTLPGSMLPDKEIPLFDLASDKNVQ